jgi:hypothetical protein
MDGSFLDAAEIRGKNPEDEQSGLGDAGGSLSFLIQETKV